jgi:hypothetical protein
VDHRRHPDTGARSLDHRHQRELSTQRQRPDHHLPGNRKDVIVAHATVAHLLTGERHILGDGGCRGITAPRPDSAGRIIRHHRYRTHRHIRAHVEQVIAPLKDLQPSMPLPR